MPSNRSRTASPIGDVNPRREPPSESRFLVTLAQPPARVAVFSKDAVLKLDVEASTVGGLIKKRPQRSRGLEEKQSA